MIGKLLCWMGLHRFTEEIIDTWKDEADAPDVCGVMTTYRMCWRCDVKRPGRVYHQVDGNWQADG